MFIDSIVRHDAVRRGAVSLALVALAITQSAVAQSRPDTSTAPPKPDPRVGLTAGWMNAGQALWNMRLVSTSAPPSQFTPENPGDFSYLNSDLAFDGRYVIQGNFQGFQIWDIAQPSHPAPVVTVVCPGSQNDVSVYRNLLFLSVESTAGRVDCGTQGVQDTVSADRMRGIRIWDITDVAHPKPIVNVQTCRGSHTHTLVTAPADTANVYIYVSGSAPVRSPTELAACSGLRPDEDPNSELFRIEVIQVPLAHPEQAHVVSKPAILAGLVHTEAHGEAPEDIAAAKRAADSARATGAYVVTVFGNEQIVPPGFVRGMLDSLVRGRHGTGAPTAADSALLRDSIQAIVDRLVAPRPWPGGVRPGPVQCHDITVYPAIGLAGGACGGYGVLLDIRDPANPRRLAAAADTNFAFWHSATFNNDGTAMLFTDEWGGGLGPKCRATDDPKWGADALFSLQGNTLTFRSYYKLPAPQTAQENCVAHNGSLIPVPGRDIMVQGWYQGGVSVFDWTDPAHPREIAFFDRGPMDSVQLQTAGSWSAYWYNGHIVSSEIGRGLDILELLPNGQLTQNEIDAANLVHVDRLNVQDQQKVVWPATFVVARAYLDQLGRSNGLPAARVAAVRRDLAGAERASGSRRRTLLTRLAEELDRDVAGAADQAKARTLAAAVRGLATSRR
ncbi:MAG TPA: hypothetical protein VKP10_04425 [Gemmatimonadales bacterium]|nr:hypothetical protein [Gemmatimonadales bacterium]